MLFALGRLLSSFSLFHLWIHKKLHGHWFNFVCCVFACCTARCYARMWVYLTIDKRFGSSGLCCCNISLALMILLCCILCHGPNSGLTELVLSPTISCERGFLIMSCPMVFELLNHPVTWVPCMSNCSESAYLLSDIAIMWLWVFFCPLSFSSELGNMVQAWFLLPGEINLTFLYLWSSKLSFGDNLLIGPNEFMLRTVWLLLVQWMC